MSDSSRVHPKGNQGAAHGCVAAGDRRTAAAGARLLEEGGNAVDAAVAAAFAAFACEPVLASPFGGGFATYSDGEGHEEAWDFFAEVPGLGLPPALEDPSLDFVAIDVSFGPTSQVFHVGRGAAAVPLILPGLVELQRAHGVKTLAEVVAPSIELARAGVPLSAEIAPIVEILEPILRFTPEASEIIAPGGRLIGEGDPYFVPQLAGLLERVAAGGKVPGRPELLEGFGPPRGRMTDADLDAAVAKTTVPIRIGLPGGLTVHLPPPPASGGLLIAFSLKLLAPVERGVWRDPGATADHLLAVMAVANQARQAALAPLLRSGAVPPDEVVAAFLGEESIRRWREPFERAVVEGPAFAAARPDNHLGRTTHVSVIDAAGRACSLTHSNGEGCGHLVPGTGMQANNFLGEEDLHPEGFHSDRPGTRLTSMMCPSIVTREGRPVLAVGSGGSNRIRSAILQVLVHALLGERPLVDAVDLPRMHLEGRTLNIERRGVRGSYDVAVLERLASRVGELVVFDTPSMYFGGAHAVGEGGTGAGDARRGGAVCRV
ncbi:MAG: gamma-glutamyltransferase [Deltaproteobacteria bacterium]|nr:gamma-glutamyltransferase [Deltaproteobacteria bacterium]